MMKKLFSALLITIACFNQIQAQCTLIASDDTQAEVIACLTACGCSNIIIPNGTTINMNGSWDLSGYGALTITIQGNGGLHFSGSGSSAEELFLAPGSQIIIANTSNSNALVQSSGGGQVRITIFGGPIYTGNDFAALIAQGGLLPVTLTDFEVTRQDKQVALNWVTATEKNNAFFEVERSADGRNYTTIGTVAGAVNSTSTKYYTLTDAKPAAGVNYYRLKQVDTDGRFSYSPVRTVVMASGAQIVAYPSPVTDVLNLQLEKPFSTDASWQVFDLNGRVLSNGILLAEQTTYTLPVAYLPEGFYVMHVQAGAETTTLRFKK